MDLKADLGAMKDEILNKVRDFSSEAHKNFFPTNPEQNKSFRPGVDSVPYAGRVFDQDEVVAATSALLDFWLTLGPEGDSFEKELAQFLGVRSSTLTNSGSSANLLAVSALTSYKLGEKRLRKGDEVITVAAGFPTTVAPLIQNNLTPVFIDNDPYTLNAKPEFLEQAYKPGKTKAVVMAHTLGNPFDLTAVLEFCKKHDLWLMEDNCDALGSTYDNKLTGTFGDLSTQSFYPPHHMTLGEGGAISSVKDARLKLAIESFRDWGRDCWCPSGKDNTCKKRFGWQVGDMPAGYDHKFIYTHMGYNLKPLDVQAAIGRQQLKKLPAFIKQRSLNWQYLRKGLDSLGEFFEFQLPTHATAWKNGDFQWDASGHRTEVSWFGFMMRVRDSAPFSKFDLARYLDDKKIGNRMLFGGNLTKQPAFKMLLEEDPGAYRIVGNLEGADLIMNQSIFIGVYPGMSHAMMDYMIDMLSQYVKSK